MVIRVLCPTILLCAAVALGACNAVGELGTQAPTHRTGAPQNRSGGDAIAGADGGPLGGSGDETAPGDAGAGGDSGAGGDDANAPVEVCDGFDNDNDGLFDEDTGGETCTTAEGADGTLRCVRGDLICEACSPGETRETACGCGPPRVDTCTDSRRWEMGTCDGCTPQTRPACERYDGCTPGDTQTRRCDTCDDIETCGVDCMGAEWLCNESCEWEQVSPCQVYEEVQCGQDDVRVEACGRCGQRVVHCDGCFWAEERCEEQGVCTPGTEQYVACEEKSCDPGHYAVRTCDQSCQWSTPSTCLGCTPGIVEEIEPCVPGASCGDRVTRFTCDATEYSICGGADTLVLGTSTEEVIRDDCLDLECLPGETRPDEECTTGLGECGNRTTMCSDTCAWDTTCVAKPEACIPGTIRETPVPCGPDACGIEYLIIEICAAHGCGWEQTGDTMDICPVCVPGEAYVEECVTELGECGTRETACSAVTCAWEEGACEPKPEGCVPGTRRDIPRGCGPGRCGAQYSETEECRADGCGWEVVASTEASCPECVEGDSYSQSCTTELGECGDQTVACDGTCSWQTGECVARSNSCIPGTVQTEEQSCNSSCDPTASRTITRTCRADGCGWRTTISGSCPCTPGSSRTRSCTDSRGRCGSKKEICSDGCGWEAQACEPHAWSCIPGETSDTTYSCGANQCGAEYVVTKTCAANGCGWQVTDNTEATCPECAAGESYSTNCTTDRGECGTRVTQCSSTTCSWEEQACVAKPEACVPGETRETSHSCGPDACGAEYVVTETCAANGCGWLQSSTTQDSCPPCAAGQSYSESCTTDVGECGSKTTTCSEVTCQWEQSACVPGPDACIPNTTRETLFSCGNDACGAQWAIIDICAPDGCGWIEAGDTQASCPPCAAGDSFEESCTTPEGECGTRETTCSTTSCAWEAGACIPAPGACVPFSQRSESCTAVCGLAGQEIYECNGAGCGWALTSTCEPIDAPACVPGQTESQLCPGCTTTHRERSCTADCNWSSWSSCPPCG